MQVMVPTVDVGAVIEADLLRADLKLEHATLYGSGAAEPLGILHADGAVVKAP